MTARQRYVSASWLLLAGIALATVGAVAWSHVDSQHHLVAKEPTVCTAPAQELDAPTTPGTVRLILRTRQPGDDCTGGESRVVGAFTTPNRVPGAALVVLGITLGLIGVTILRREPDPSPVA